MSRLLNYRRERLERNVEHLHLCGARATFEFLIELADVCGCQNQLTELLENWQKLNPQTLQALGGDRFVARQLRAVPADLWEVS